MNNSFQSNIWKSYLFSFLRELNFLSGVLIPFFTDWGKISFYQIMVLQSWFVLWAFLLEMPTGAVADFLGRKISLLCGTVCGIFAVLVYTSQPDFLAFLAGEFLFAFAFALFSGADEALVYDSLKALNKEKESKKILARFESMSMIGLVVGAPIGSLIAVSLGLRWAMFLMVVPLTFAFFVALTLHEPKSEERKESMRYVQTLKGGIKYFSSHRTLQILVLDGVVVAILIFFLIWTYQLLLKQLDFPLIYFGIIHAFIALSQVAVMNNFERMERISGSKSRYLFFSALVSGIGFIFLGISGHVILSIIAMMIISGFGLSRFVLVSNYMQKHIDSHNRATVLSAASMFRRFGIAIAYPLVGMSVEWSLNYTFILIGTTIVLFSFIPKTKDHHLLD